MKKIKNNNLILGGICLGIIFGVVGFILNSYSVMEPIPSISFSSNELNYNSKEPGSFQVTKSGKWISQDKIRITFDLDTISLINEKEKNIVLVLDTSSSMEKGKLEEIKVSAKTLVNTFLTDSKNKIALIEFNETSSIKSELTNDQESLNQEIEKLATNTEIRNYYQALVSVDTVLNQSKKESIVFFVTGGYPNTQTPNEESEYQYLKEQYPNLTIYGIQYEMGSDFLEPVEKVSDYQYLTTRDNFTSLLLYASSFSERYKEFTLKDQINTIYFDEKTVSNVQVTEGQASTKGNEVTWNLSGLGSGRKATLTMDVSLQDEYKGNEGTFPTNEREEVAYEIGDTKEKVESTKTPVVGTHYEVTYEGNAPKGCSVRNVPEKEKIRVYEKVEVSSRVPICEGYQFQGWRHTTEGVQQVSESEFLMPEKNVVLRATWTSLSIVKSLDGRVANYAKPVIQNIGENYDGEFWAYKDQVKKVVIQDYMKQIPNAIEVFDISEAKNGGVLAYVVEENGGYTVYIQGEGKVETNPDSSHLFEGFKNLETIEGLENLDTSNTTNMSNMFKDCSNLKELDVSNFDTSNVTDMSGMFEGCKNVKELDVSGFDTGKVTDMSNMFKDCENVKNLDVSNFDTSNVTDMSGMFEGCKNVTDLDVSGFDTGKVTDMSNMFKDCENVKNLDVSNFDTSNVTDMSGMFEGCKNVTDLDVSGFDTGKVTDMSNMFKDCENIKDLDLSNFNTEKVTDMSDMFNGCKNLTNVDPKNFKVPDGTDTSGIFDGCENLTEIPVKKTYEVTLLANANGSITPVTLSVDFGNTNIFTVTPNEGYYLSDLVCTNGYTTNAVVGEGATESQAVTVSNNGQNAGSTCTASFKLATYTIEYNLNGGTLSGTNPTTYTAKSEEIILLPPTRTGYNFTGWTGSNGETAETNVTIPTGSFGNKNYSANWEANKYELVFNKQCT
ncbi:MAG: BspA family leucine-rich repeat surface protein, partial [Bacilli bacterium]|nr:BspA family leucine-rich repeat surface protein [Bacilli bacterium]